jgi:hypothetical protein
MNEWTMFGIVATIVGGLIVLLRLALREDEDDPPGSDHP